ncbi:hypothetical protein [Anaerosalibacter sp. Marseille-P3206]|uniref:hypothetical protein n=1 Tax=Anaerosalibacter sp. Marseille-P3206 TaxID=1871005 RepID=UPI0009871C49|nr:hypothetical protein [Anaerosalibacter sp. Marseille-P3206]
MGRRDNNSWEKPNELFAILRCTNKKYAKRFVDLGSIKFNTPKSWVEEEKGKGKGDILEGVFAACDMLDAQRYRVPPDFCRNLLIIKRDSNGQRNNPKS